MKFIALFLIGFKVSTAFGAVDFFANSKLHKAYPEAFATSKVNLPFHHALSGQEVEKRKALVQAIQKDKKLVDNILHFNNLLIHEQVDVLKQLFDIECKILNIVPPELIIDENSITGSAFFEFDYDQGGAGRVFLNKKKLINAPNKSKFIILLLHETRHSAQFQMSQASNNEPLSQRFKISFKAQKLFKEHKIKTSFCDFMLLLNEFEAFQFANFVYGALINWSLPINDLGTLGSQYDKSEKLRIDFVKLLSQSDMDPLELFNQLEEEQYNELHINK